MSGRKQLTRGEIRRMPMREIVEARKRGELDDLLAGRDPLRVPELPELGENPKPNGSADLGARADGPMQGEQLTRDDLRRMTPAQIVHARREGRLEDLRRGIR